MVYTYNVPLKKCETINFTIDSMAGNETGPLCLHKKNSPKSNTFQLYCLNCTAEFFCNVIGIGSPYSFISVKIYHICVIKSIYTRTIIFIVMFCIPEKNI